VTLSIAVLSKLRHWYNDGIGIENPKKGEKMRIKDECPYKGLLMSEVYAEADACKTKR